MLLWRFPTTVRGISSGVLGGGLGEYDWVLNAEVTLAYRRSDPGNHLAEIGEELGLRVGAGSALMTATDIRAVAVGVDGAVRCDATVGLSYPTWAAASLDAPLPASRWRPGTINLVCLLPVPLSDAALVNAVMTATEAKTQALIEAAVPGTGTASDAIVICCPKPSPARPGEPYAGPRSPWGARLARAVHAAVSEGIARYCQRHPPGG